MPEFSGLCANLSVSFIPNNATLRDLQLHFKNLRFLIL